MVQLSGGAKLKSYLESVAKKVSNPGTLQVGFLSGATYPDGTSVAMVAAIHNFGAPAANIPRRPFFSNMVAAKRASWPKVISSELARTNYDAKQALEVLGEVIIGDLKDSINNGSYAPLKKATAKAKGFDKPLIDTGVMINMVNKKIV